FSFGPSSSSLKNLPDLTSVAKISSQGLLAAVGLHNLSFSERNLSTLQQVAPLDQISKTRNNSGEPAPATNSERFQSQIPPPSDL
ncbi:hypothetical protein ILYODFUR_036470, partial [Ilyodon furcidens]